MIDCMEIPVLCSNNETKFVISLAPDTKLTAGKELYFNKHCT